jgi:hypothetical protein
MWRTLRIIRARIDGEKDIPKQTEAEKYCSEAKDARYTFLLVITACTVRYFYYAWFADEKLSLAENTFAWLLIIGAYVRAKFYELQAGQAVQVAILEVLLQLAEREKLGTPTI